MKKIAFLGVILSCWIGSVWGQTITVPSDVAILCYGGKAAICVEINGAASTDLFSIELWHDGGVIQRLEDVVSSCELEVTESGLYNVRVRKNGSTVVIGGQRRVMVSAPTSAFEGDGYFITDMSCSSDGEIRASVIGGTRNYTFRLTEVDEHGELVDEQTISAVEAIFKPLEEGTYHLSVTDKNGCGPIVYPNLVINMTPLAEGDIHHVEDITCKDKADGVIEVKAKFGKAPYWFDLNYGEGNDYDDDGDGIGVFAGLSAGEHTVTVYDEYNCGYDVTVTLDEPAEPVSATVSDIQNVTTCYNDNTGAFTVTAQGGTPEYTFSIPGKPIQTGTSAIFTGLVEGDYTVTVTDSKGCDIPEEDVLDPVHIDAPSQITLVSTPDDIIDVTCFGDNGGSITVLATGGTGDIEYRINGGAYQSSGTFTGLTAGTYTITAKDANGCTETLSGIEVDQPDTQITFGESIITAVKCFGGNDGSIEITATGGTGAIEYSINGDAYQSSGTFTGLTADTYTITAKDANGCTETLSGIEVDQPLSQITFGEPAITAVKCFGGNDGSIEITATGGTGAIEYSIDGGAYQSSGTFTDLTADTYTITAKDANGCTETLSGIEVGQPGTQITFVGTSDIIDVKCFGGKDGGITVSATGGIGAIEYSIDGGAYQSSGTFTGLTAGTYTITAKDANGCTETLSGIEVGQPSTQITLVSTPDDIIDVTCFGGNDGSITVSATGGTGAIEYSIDGGAYQSSGTFTGLTAGTYTITAKDANGCTETLSGIEVGQPSTQITLVSTPDDIIDVTCFGGNDGSITVSATGGTGSFEYSINGGAYQSSGAFTGLTAGTYTITAKDANGCTETLSGIEVSQPSTQITLVSTPDDIIDVTCFGGNDGSITVSATGGTGSFEYSINGGAYQSSGAFTGLTAGTYTITAKDANGCTVSSDIITVGTPEQISFNIPTTTPVSCYTMDIPDGTITVTGVTGGTAPYQYSIDGEDFYDNNGIFTGVASGTYTVTVKDVNDCKFFISNNVVGTPAQITFGEQTVTNVTCFGYNDGSIEIIATGGTGSIEYSIDGGETYQPNGIFPNLAKGTYIITAKDANGCTVSSPSILVDAPAEITGGTLVSTPMSCNAMDLPDGTITVTGVTGGTAPYQYSIDDGGNFKDNNGLFTGLADGDYTVTVRDANGCEAAVGGTEVAAPDAITITKVTQTPEEILCFVDPSEISFTVDAKGETGRVLMYSMNGSEPVAGNEFTALEGVSDYTFKVTYASPYAGCAAAEETITDVTIPSQVTFDLISTPVGCFAGDEKIQNGTITVTASGGSGSYIYSLNGEGVTITGQASNVFAGLASGEYTITVEDSNGCGGVSEQPNTIDVDPATEITYTPEHTDISCPTADPDGTITVTASGGAGAFTYALLIINGETETVLQDNNTTGSFTGLDEGTYYVRITDGNNCMIATDEFVIARPTAIGFTAVPAVPDLGCSDATTFVTVNVTTPTSGKLVYKIDGGVWTPYVFNGTNEIHNVGSGTHDVSVAYEDGKDCADMGTETIILNPILLKFTVAYEPLKCVEQTTDITITIDEAPAAGSTVQFRLMQEDEEIRPAQQGLVFEDVPGGDYIVVAEVTDAAGNTCTNSRDVSVDRPDPVSVNVTSSSPKCFNGKDGEIIVVASGGTGSFTYTITSSVLEGGSQSNTTGIFGNLADDTYVITVKNSNDCSIGEISNVTLTAPSTAPTVTIASISHLSCIGGKTGAVHAITNGGTAPYIYKWYGPDSDEEWTDFAEQTIGGRKYSVASHMGAGEYIVEVTDANGCTVTEIAEVRQPDELTITLFEKMDVTACDGAQNNGFISVKVEGGRTPYEFMINDAVTTPEVEEPTIFTFNNLTSGTYNITVRGDGFGSCGGEGELTSVVISAPTALTADIEVDQPISCFDVADGILTVTPSGGGSGEQTVEYTYLWSNGATTPTISDLDEGAYTVMVTATTETGTCSKEFTADELTQPEQITVTPDHTDITCFGANDGTITLTIEGGTPAYVISWTGPDGYTSSDAAITGLTKQGTYTYSVTDANNCLAATGEFYIDEPAVIENITIEGQDGAVLTPEGDVNVCFGTTATLTVTAAGDQDKLVYKLDDSNWQTSNEFTNVPQGDHTVYAGYRAPESEEVNCATPLAFKVIEAEELRIDNVDPIVGILPCDDEDATVMVTVTANVADGRTSISMDGEEWQDAQNSNFELGAGTYTAYLRFNAEPYCTVSFETQVVIKKDIDITVSESTVTGTPLNCGEDATASITINATSESNKILEYALRKDGQDDPSLTWQEDNEFENLGKGNYIPLVRYQNETCYQPGDPVNIEAPAVIDPATFELIIGKEELDCAIDATTVIVNIPDEEPDEDIVYTIDGTTWYNAGVEIPDVKAGTYQVRAGYRVGTADPKCTVTGESFEITAPKAIEISSAAAVETTLACFDETTAINVVATGDPDYELEYVLTDGTDTWTSPDGKFTDMGKGDYTVRVLYANKTPSCEVTWTGEAIEIDAPDEIEINGFTTDKNTLQCKNSEEEEEDKATLTITATGDPRYSLEYSIDGGSTWDNDGIFEGKGVDNYTACVRYAGTECKVCYKEVIQIKSAGAITDVLLDPTRNMLGCNEDDFIRFTVTVNPATPEEGDYEYQLNGQGGWLTKEELENTDIKIVADYTVIVRNTLNQGCKQLSNSVLIEKLEPITASWVVDDPGGCNDIWSRVEVTATGSANKVLHYKLSRGPNFNNSISNPNDKSDHSFLAVGDATYKVRVSYADYPDLGCGYTSEPFDVKHVKGITIESVVPDIDVNEESGAIELCAGTTTTLTVTATGDDRRVMQFSIDGGETWYDGTGIGTGEGYLYTDTYEFTVGAGTYDARVRYKKEGENNECTTLDVYSQNFTVVEWLPIEFDIPTGLKLDCVEGATVDATVSVTGQADKAIEVRLDGGDWVLAESGSYTFEGLSVGQYDVSARYLDNPNCEIAALVKLDIRPNIDLTFTGEGLGVFFQVEGKPDVLHVKGVPYKLDCPADKVTLYVKVSGTESDTDVEYTINGGKNWSGALNGLAYQDQPAGTYKIGARYAAESNCIVWYEGNDVVIDAPEEITIGSVVVSGGVTFDNDAFILACSGDRATIDVYVESSDPDMTVEYNIYPGEDKWQDEYIFTEVPGGTYTARVRYKGTACAEKVYASEITIFEPAPVTIANVWVDGEEGVTEKELACADETVTIKIEAAGEVRKQGYDLEYSIDGADWRSTSEFKGVKPNKTYTPQVRYKDHTECEPAVWSEMSVTAPEAIVIGEITTTPEVLECVENATAAINVTVDSDPDLSLEYSLNGIDFMPFEDLPELTSAGAYTLYVRYANHADDGCVVWKAFNVKSNLDITGVTAEASKDHLACTDEAIITVTVASWNTDKTLQYRLYDGAVYGEWQTAGEFKVTEGGNYTAEVSYKDEVPLCAQPSNVVPITQSEPITGVKAAAAVSTVDCYDGTTTVNITTDVPEGTPLQYILYTKDNEVVSTKSTPVFTGVRAGEYYVAVSYADGTCTTSSNPVRVIALAKRIEIDRIPEHELVRCEGGVTTVTVLMRTGDEYEPVANLQYSAEAVEGGTTIDWQSSNELVLSPGTYTIQVRSTNSPNCIVTRENISVLEPNIIDASANADKNVLDCDDPEDKAVITITASAKESSSSSNVINRPLEYFVEGVTDEWQTYPGTPVDVDVVSIGTYNVLVRFADDNEYPCEKLVATIPISGDADITVQAEVTKQITCSGGLATIGGTVTSKDMGSISGVEVQCYNVITGEGESSWMQPTLESKYTFSFKVLEGTYVIMVRLIGREDCIVYSSQVVVGAPKPITVTVTGKTDASGCYGDETLGSATIEALGGTAPYQYSVDGGTTWNDFPDDGSTAIVSDLKTGSHTILVKGAGFDAEHCTVGETTVTIANRDEIKLWVDPTPIRCFGEANGRLEIQIMQGRAPFKVTVIQESSSSIDYYIENTTHVLELEDLKGGMYTIKVVDGNDCEKVQEIKVTAPTEPLLFSITPINICPGGKIGDYIMETKGGQPGYRYFWYRKDGNTGEFASMYPGGDGGIDDSPKHEEGLVPGEYQVIAEDAYRCNVTVTFEIIKIEALTLEGVEPKGVACASVNSGSVQVVNPAGGAGGPYEYRIRDQRTNALVSGFDKYTEWANELIEGLSQGEYILEMVDGRGKNCTPLTHPFVIGVESGINLSEPVYSPPTCFDGNDGKFTGITIDGTVKLEELEYAIKRPTGETTAWQPTAEFDGVTIGEYTLYVREQEGKGNGCEAELSFTIDRPKEIKIETAVVDPACDSDGRVEITVTGGTGMLTVECNIGELTDGTFDAENQQWTGYVIPKKGGQLVIEVADANECPATSTIELGYTTDLEFSEVTPVDNTCPDDENASITVLAIDNSAAPHSKFTYRLYTGTGTVGNPLEVTVEGDLTQPAVFSGLAGGDYTLSMQADGDGCFTQDYPVTIGVTNKIELIDPRVAADCPLRLLFDIKGESTNASYGYSIDGGDQLPIDGEIVDGYLANAWIPFNAPGTYKVTIYYGDCSYTQEFVVESKVIPQVVGNPATGCYGEATGSITITMPDGSGVPYGYWYTGMESGTFRQFSGISTTIPNLEVGTYEVIVQRSGGCISETHTVEVMSAPKMETGYVEAVPITCTGNYGEVDVTITGGTAPYEVTLVPQEEGGWPQYAETPILDGMHLSNITGGTYRIAVTDGAGCKDILEVNIVAPQVVEIKATSHLALCGEFTSTVAIEILKPTEGIFEYYVDTELVKTISGRTYAFPVEVTGEHTYNIWVKERSSECIATADVTVNVPQQLDLTLAVTKEDLGNCEFTANLDVAIAGGVEPYTIKVNGTPIEATGSTILEGLSAGTYEVEVRDGNDCSVVKSEVIELPTPVGEITPTIIDVYCSQDGTGSIVLFPDDYTYTWEDGTVGPELSGLNAGDYKVNISNGSCSVDAVYTVGAEHKIEITDLVTQSCPPRVLFAIKGDPSNTSYSYSVDGGDPIVVEATDGIALDIMIKREVPGEFPVTISYGEGCVDMHLFTIEPSVAPDIVPSHVTGCHGDATGSINITVTDKMKAPYEYWYSGMDQGTYQPFTGMLNTTIGNLKAGDYQVMVRDGSNCYSNTFDIRIEDIPAMTITYTEVVPITCIGAYGEGDITIEGGSGDYSASIVPQVEGGYPIYAEMPVVTPTYLSNITGGTYLIAVVDNATGCKDTLKLTFEAPKMVTIAATHTPVICGDDPATITVQVTEPTEGNFEFYRDLNDTEPQGSGTDNSYIFNLEGVTGKHTYHLKVRETTSGCIATTPVDVDIPQPMVLILSHEERVDQASCTYTADLAVNITGGVEPYIIWVNNEQIEATGSTILEGKPEGVYHVKVQDAKGCQKDENKTVTLPVAIKVDATVRPMKCNQDNTGSIVLSPDTYTYTWEDGVVGRERYDLAVGDYKVTVSNGSCSIEQVYSVTADYTIDVAVTANGGNVNIFCPGADVVLNGTVTINGTPMVTTTTDAFASWILPDGETKEFMTNNPLVITAADGTIRLSASSGGCTSIAAFEVVTMPTPTIAFAVDTIYIPKDEIYTLQVEASEYGTYQWSSDPDGHKDLPAPPADALLASPETPYTLTLTLTGVNGCSVADTIYVSRSLDFFIPNAFTPNDDGTHDRWMFRNIDQYIGYYDIQVMVVNRGGFQVYSATGYNNAGVVWDGRRNGSDLPIGTYYYVVKLVPKSSTGTVQTFTGSVTIIR